MLKPLFCTLAAIAKRTSGNKRMHLMNEKDESKSNAGMQERKNARHGDDDVIVSFCPSKCINKIWWWWVHTRHTDNFWITVNNSESIFSVPHKHIWRRRWKKNDHVKILRDQYTIAWWLHCLKWKADHIWLNPELQIDPIFHCFGKLSGAYHNQPISSMGNSLIRVHKLY